MSKDYMKSLAILLNATYFRHVGCLVEKSENGFKWNGVLYNSEDEVKEAIEKTFPKLEDSINRLKK